MEINSLAATHIDNYRMSSNALGSFQNTAEGGKSFAEIYAKTSPDALGETQAEAGAGRKVTIDKTDKLYEQCLELETFLVKTLISSMRNTVQKSGLVDEGFAGKMYEDMLYDEYAKEFTKNAGFGLADQAYLELTGQRGQVPRAL